MKAVIVDGQGAIEDLKLGDIESPTPTGHEILIKVQAAAVNRMDLLQRRGLYPVPEGASDVLGVDVAGVVESVGENVTKWKPGDKVMSLLDGGGYAELALAHEDMVMPKPDNLSFEEAAAIPEVFLTAYQCLFLIADLQPNQTALIHAGASGVGTAAIQLVRSRDAIPFVTAGSQEKITFCRDLGAQFGVNYKEEDFAEKILEVTQNQGVNVVLDFVGAAYWEKNVQVLAQEGHLVIIAYLSGSKVENVDLRPIQRKWASMTGTTLRARSQEYKHSLVQSFTDYSLVKFHDGRLKPVVDSVYDWNDVQDAHRHMEANANIGKIILKGM